MKKIKTIFVLGILTAIFPFLGFPGFVKTSAVLIFGVGIAAISGILIIENRNRNQSSLSDGVKKLDAFVDNKKDFLQKDYVQKTGGTIIDTVRNMEDSKNEPPEEEITMEEQ